MKLCWSTMNRTLPPEEIREQINPCAEKDDTKTTNSVRTAVIQAEQQNQRTV